jgi:hypothetical protein
MLLKYGSLEGIINEFKDLLSANAKKVADVHDNSSP